MASYSLHGFSRRCPQPIKLQEGSRTRELLDNGPPRRTLFYSDAFVE